MEFFLWENYSFRAGLGIKPVLMEKYGVTRLGVFGSVARDEATETSDVDVVVEMPPDLFAMVHIKEYLQETSPAASPFHQRHWPEQYDSTELTRFLDKT